MRSDIRRAAALVLLLGCLASCGLLVSFDDFDTSAIGGSSGGQFAVGGRIEGLGGVMVALSLNGGAPFRAPDGDFTFPTLLADGADYVVGVTSDGTPQGHACFVERGASRIAGASVTDVLVRCPSNDPRLESLSVSTGPLQPTFQADAEQYVGTGTFRASALPLQLATVTVDAKTRAPGARIAIAKASPVVDVAHVDLLLALHDAPIAIVVTAPDGVTTKKYAVTLAGEARSDYVKAENTHEDDNFGATVALSGDTLVVGDPRESSSAKGVGAVGTDTSAPSTGAAFVYRRVAGTWKLEAYLKASNSTFGVQARFGSSVTIDGDTIVIGAPSEASRQVGVGADPAPTTTDTMGTGSGAAYVFSRTGTTWKQTAYLKATTVSTNPLNFGAAVALSGNTLVVGAPYQDTAAPVILRVGAAYVFTRAAGSWASPSTVTPRVARTDLAFGYAVAAAGSLVAVAAVHEASSAVGVTSAAAAVMKEMNVDALGAGAVFLYAGSGGTWTEQWYVKASNTRAAASFGASLALTSDTLVVGSDAESSGSSTKDTDTSVNSAGAAYVFRKNGATWSQEAYLKASTIGPSRFGSSAALVGDVLVVGAPHDGSASTGLDGDEMATTATPQSGAAHIFLRTGTSWKHLRYLKASNTRQSALFGASVALAESAVAVGAPGESGGAVGVNGNQKDAGAPSSGAAYVW